MSRDTGLHPRMRLANNMPDIRKPRPLSCFSVNNERFYEKGAENLRYLNIPRPQQLPLDLNKGYGFAKRKGEVDEKLDHLLEHIRSNYSELINMMNANTDKVLTQQIVTMPLYPIEFVSWRGLLRKIMCTPFEYKSDWIVEVTHFRGTYYLCERKTEENYEKDRNPTPREDRMTSWGYKFEQYCLTKSPGMEPDTNVPVDECSEMGCVFQTKLEGIDMLYGAEMDGIKCEQPIDINRCLQAGKPVEFIELKTGIMIQNDRQMFTFKRYKTCKWWCQSFLVGIENIVAGWRDDNGLVQNIEEIRVKELAKQCDQWTPERCTRFLVEFLRCVKFFMSTVDCPYTVYEFRFNAKRSIITYEIFQGPTALSFLPDHYIHFVENVSKANK